MYKLRNIILVGLTMACVGCVTIPTEYESPFRKATNVRKVEVNKNGTNYVLDAAMNHYEIKTDNRYIHEEGVIYHMMLDEYRKGE